ncbi:MAG: flagellar type III secretion system pore protein FliP [Defluviitaleaceae bacterium]|nr:flagellar type III secretion system pore protein FliP [Defluviitaleaceae bacterium]
MQNMAKIVKAYSKHKRVWKILFVCALVFVAFSSSFASEQAQAGVFPGLPEIYIMPPADGMDDEALQGSVTLQILFLSVIVALLPALLVVMTSFTRLIIIFSFLRSGLGTQQMPPNTVLIGIALVLTMFIMNPYFTEINENAIQPMTAGYITQEEAIENGMAALRRFMLGRPGTQMQQNIVFFSEMAGVTYETNEEGFIIDVDTIPNYVLIPAFMLHELAVGFAFGVFIFIPFIIIDMVVASVLMAMGMMMLPPVMISLPFKIMLFVLVDGWQLIVQTVMMTF